MKKKLWIGFIVLAIVFSTVVIGGKYLPRGGAAADNLGTNHTISVSGEGIVQTIPDIAVVNFGVNIQKKTAIDAMNELTAVSNKTVDTLKNAGVENKNIKTTNISLEPVYQWNKEKNISTLIGYKASESFEIRGEIKDTGRIIGLISNSGVNSISGIRFDISDKSMLDQDAITRAMKNARTKAEASLKGSNYKIVGIKTISINSNNPVPVYRDNMAIAGEKTNIPVEGGSISIRAQVQVVFIFD